MLKEFHSPIILQLQLSKATRQESNLVLSVHSGNNFSSAQLRASSE